MNVAGARLSARTLRIEGASEKSVERDLADGGLSLTVDEARRVAGLLGRDPTTVEAHIFNTMWSEHCSYKSSRTVLATHLPTEGPGVVLGPGEDAGVVRLCEVDGSTYCIAIAHESHNHPSQVVPNEGAATGIGGIVRDVYCMGADVVGVLDPLRFGDPSGAHAERVAEIVHGVVEGIWQYGNALGVPNLGGDVYFDGSFDDNCLVNVIAIGIVREQHVIRSRVPEEARTEEYDVVLVGKPTDPSGFGGATFASRILDEERAFSDKYAVQVPDPFLKRMLTVATADVLSRVRAEGIAIGFKDLGAGGIACATSELGAAAGLGVRIDLSRVEVAEEGMLPEVIACSETQERYAFVVPRTFTPDMLRIFNEDFELPELCHDAMAKVIGEVIPEPKFVLTHGGAVVCEASTQAITAGISYEREATERPRGVREVEPPADLDVAAALLKAVGSPNIASREHVYRHYDSEVKGNTVIRPGEADACVIAPIPGSAIGVAVSADGNPFIGAVDPYQAGAAAVAEAVRNVAAVGAVPIALTDCLNFGNPEIPEVFHDFVEAVRGIGDAARELGRGSEAIPVISGNVSFYNQSATGNAVLPSPIVCVIGRLEDHTRAVTAGLKGAGNEIYLLGERYGELGASEFARTVLGEMGRNVPRVRFDDERAMVESVIGLAEAGLLESCHDVSEGGFAGALAEAALMAARDSFVGVRIDLAAVAEAAPVDVPTAARLLFCENGGFVIEVSRANAAAVRRALERGGVWFRRAALTTSDPAIGIEGIEGERVSLALDEIRRNWAEGAAQFMR